MELLAIREDNITNIYEPENIKEGSLDKKMVFMHKANSDIMTSGKHTNITINCRCFECINKCIQGSKSGGRSFETFADYYIHICDVMKKDIEIFKCPCKGCPWSVVRAFGAMIKHLSLHHTDIHESFSTMCDGDFTKLWVSADNDKWTAVMKFKKVVVTESVSAPVPVENSISWEEEPTLGTAKNNTHVNWTKPPQLNNKKEINIKNIIEEFSELVDVQMKQVCEGPLNQTPNVFINGIEYSHASAPWDIKLDKNNKMFTGIMPKKTIFYDGFCPNERPLTVDEARSSTNNNYCLDPDCSFDHMDGWSDSFKKEEKVESESIVETTQELTSAPVEDNDPELETIFVNENLELLTLNEEDIIHTTLPKKQRGKRNNKENLAAFEDTPEAY